MESWLLLAVHAFATLGMVGVIWFVQVVHYPLFAEVGRAEFCRYEALHQRLTTRVVAPLMLAELTAAVGLLLFPPAPAFVGPSVLGLLLIGVLWASTFFWQVPLHRRLSLGFEPDVQRRLVHSNWLRTAAWTGRGVLALWLFNVAS